MKIKIKKEKYLYIGTSTIFFFVLLVFLVTKICKKNYLSIIL